jgi:hypothetical protein
VDLPATFRIIGQLSMNLRRSHIEQRTQSDLAEMQTAIVFYPRQLREATCMNAKRDSRKTLRVKKKRTRFECAARMQIL